MIISTDYFAGLASATEEKQISAIDSALEVPPVLLLTNRPGRPYETMTDGQVLNSSALISKTLLSSLEPSGHEELIAVLPVGLWRLTVVLHSITNFTDTYNSASINFRFGSTARQARILSHFPVANVPQHSIWQDEVYVKANDPLSIIKQGGPTVGTQTLLTFYSLQAQRIL